MSSNEKDETQNEAMIAKLVEIFSPYNVEVILNDSIVDSSEDEPALQVRVQDNKNSTSIDTIGSTDIERLNLFFNSEFDHLLIDGEIQFEEAGSLLVTVWCA